MKAMCLLELELARALLTVGLCFGGAVGVDGFLCKVVRASAGGDQGRPPVAVALLTHCGSQVAAGAAMRSCDVLNRFDLELLAMHCTLVSR